MAGTPTIKQPPFDPRISTLAFPLTGGQYGTIQRGYMTWASATGPYSDKAQVNFLYNPSSVTADYYMADNSVGASIMFPTAFDSTNLRVPLNQSVTWSLLFDRTFELWGTYESNGNAGGPNTPGQNNPNVVGVLADIMAMEQFTGMFMAYSTGNTQTTSPASSSLTGWQGIMQLIPSYVYFGGGNSASTSLWYYGYVSEWDVTITHWTQYMIPMRCVINITFTMLPPPQGGSPQSQVVPTPSGQQSTTQALTTLPTAGVSGR